MNELHLDFEVRSECDLKSEGLAKYAAHYSTEIVSIAYAINDKPVRLVRHLEELPLELLEWFSSRETVTAHNAYFEKEVWNAWADRIKLNPKYRIKPEVIDCTMVRALSMALPGSLEDLAIAVGSKNIKDKKGHGVMLRLCKPRKIENGQAIYWDLTTAKDDKEFNKVYEMFEALYAYNIQDVETERECAKALRVLSPEETSLWRRDLIWNRRGIPVSVKDAKLLNKVVGFAAKNINERLKEVTNYAVSSVNEVAAILDWAACNGSQIKDLTKETVALELKDEHEACVLEALRLRQEGAKSSTAKIKKFIKCAGDDERIRFCFQFHGAGTGRWAGRMIQPQNLPRQSMSQKELEGLFDLLNDIGPEAFEEFSRIAYGSAMDTVSEMIRGLIAAPEGHDLISADLAQIEVRVLAWLAGNKKLLEKFKNGEDVYVYMASEIYKIPESEVTKEQRQIGKVALLALGYQGGAGAFESMAANYGVYVDTAEANEIKERYRRANPETVTFWYNCEEAAMKAVLNRGKAFKVGNISFVMGDLHLWCKLPSGRTICYPYAEVKEAPTKFGYNKKSITYMGYDWKRKWTRRSGYGGLIVENVAQAVARDVIAYGLMLAEDKGYPVVVHVHDEGVSQVPEGFGSVEEYESILSSLPPWAEGLPLKAEGWRGKRYRK